MRRVFDFLVATVALVVFAPVISLIALAVKVTSRGPVFHRARRVGRDRKPFTLFKFRTMGHAPEGQGPAITLRDDPRVTHLGRMLRRTKIDELPQLVNVIRGDMALVGPRPEDECYLQYYRAEELRVLSVRPGMTSPISLRYQNEEELLHGEDWHDKYVNQLIHDKLRGELDYLERRTFWSDLGVLFRTVAVLLRS
jgi:lipopolysaccharide/colanic/teichoic acid biosynthesis glycosyltransferase